MQTGSPVVPESRKKIPFDPESMYVEAYDRLP
jgi:hypothetical protein